MNWLLHFFSNVGDKCNITDSGFLGLPSWYHYLPGKEVYLPGTNANTPNTATICNPTLSNINDVWLVGLAVIEILLRIAAIAAVIMVIYGGVQLMSSQGNPENVAKARKTLLNAIVGLLIAVGAATIISFIAGTFTT